MAPEINSAMQQISESAGVLQKDYRQLLSFIELLETTPTASPEDLEAIQHYREFINYEKIRQQIDELMETIHSGAAWSEQLADLLKLLTAEDSPKPQDDDSSKGDYESIL
jgi:hypothetical protein